MDDDERTAMSALLHGDAARFSELSERMLNLLSSRGGRVDSASLAKQRDAVDALLRQVDALEQTVQAHVRLAYSHQRDHAQIQHLEHDLRLRDKRVQALLAHLALCHSTLLDETEAGTKQLEQIQHADAHPLNLGQTLSYASRLAGVTAAPPEEGLGGEKEVRAAQYPFPDEGLIRNGAFALGPVAAVVPPPPEGGEAHGSEEPTVQQHTVQQTASQEGSVPAFEEIGDDAFDLDL